jgi:hypothetical protein
MTQAELNQAVASHTGESLRTIRRRGFSIVQPLQVFDPDDLMLADPQVVDWDEADAARSRTVA